MLGKQTKGFFSIMLKYKAYRSIPLAIISVFMKLKIF